MSTKRYYKLKDFIVRKGFDIELSELQFLGLTGNAIPFTVTTNYAPIAGSLSYLNDGLTNIDCVFNGIKAVGLEVLVDFGSDLTDTVVEVQLGAGSSSNTFPLAMTIEVSSDTVVWSTITSVFDMYQRKQFVFNGSHALQTTANLPANLKTYNFDGCAFGTATLREDGFIFINATDNNSHKLFRPKNCKPLRNGKWYFEVTGQVASGGVVGTPEEASGSVANYVGDVGIVGPNTGLGYWGNSFYEFLNGNATTKPTLNRNNINLATGFCLDLDNLKLTAIGENPAMASYSVDITPSATGEYYPAVSPSQLAGTTSFTANTGLAPFTHAIPNGYTRLSDFDAAVYSITDDINYGENGLLKLYTTQRADALNPKSQEQIKITAIGYRDMGRNQGYIKGNVYLTGGANVYLRRRVALIEVSSGKFIESLWSTAGTGEYQFSYLDMTRKYVTWTFDPNDILQPTISSVMTPQKMPVFV